VYVAKAAASDYAMQRILPVELAHAMLLGVLQRTVIGTMKRQILPRLTIPYATPNDELLVDHFLIAGIPLVFLAGAAVSRHDS